MTLICVIFALFYFINGVIYLFAIMYLLIKKTNKDDLHNNQYPFVSVIILSRNEYQSIFKCLECLKNQSYPIEKFEIIPVNDGSEDGTDQIIDGMAENDPHIKPVHISVSKRKNQGKLNAIDIGIMVYHTHWLRGGRIEVETILNMSEIENVVSIKWSNPADVAFDEMSKFSDRFNVINNGGDPVTAHELGGRGYINLTAHSYPKHDLTIWDLMENKKYDEARELYKTVDEPLRKINEKINERSGGQGRIVKGMMALMGLPCGASRPPSEAMDVNELNELRALLVSFGWPVQLTGKQAFEQTT